MKCQILFSGKNKKNITNLLSAELVQRVVTVKQAVYVGLHLLHLQYEPVHDKTYNKTCVTSKDSNQPVHLPSMARILLYFSLDSLEVVEGTCDQ